MESQMTHASQSYPNFLYHDCIHGRVFVSYWYLKPNVEISFLAWYGLHSSQHHALVLLRNIDTLHHTFWVLPSLPYATHKFVRRHQWKYGYREPSSAAPGGSSYFSSDAASLLLFFLFSYFFFLFFHLIHGFTHIQYINFYFIHYLTLVYLARVLSLSLYTCLLTANTYSASLGAV